MTGRELVFTELDPLTGRGSELARIEIDLPSHMSFDLSPDGSRVAVTNWDNHLRVLTLDSAETRDLSGDPWSGMDAPAWSADGAGVFVAASESPWGVELIHIDLGGEVQVVRQTGNAWTMIPVPSPDGLHLAYGALIVERNAWMIEDF